MAVWWSGLEEMHLSNSWNALDVTPSAKRLTSSLRDIGYDFVSAIADIVDNSISANATRIDIELTFEGEYSHIVIADNGTGMSPRDLTEALRFGSRREYGSDELGRYGLGLKTASLSQCKRVTVVTRKARIQRRLSTRTLDLDHIIATDRWELTGVPDESRAHKALEWLDQSTGTVVVWERLDRILPAGREGGGGARRRMNSLGTKLVAHLAAVFHRFIEGRVDNLEPLTITVNGEKVAPWNPFAPDEEHLVALPTREFQAWAGEASGTVTFSPYVLPARSLFSSAEEFERLSGSAKWNRQQGLYIYRANRLIQAGGWCGLRAIDEHTKLARAAIDFAPDLDEMFRINVAKMRAALPVEIAPLLEPHVTDLCHRAQEMYRRDHKTEASHDSAQRSFFDRSAGDVGGAILSAALATGTADAISRIAGYLRVEQPDLAEALGW